MEIYREKLYGRSFVLKNRFEASEYTVTDRKTGLMWVKNAGISEFPLTWKEAFEFTEDLNRDAHGGFTDWRLPNRRELFSLVSHENINPTLDSGHSFVNVFQGYYWTASTCARVPAQAWYVHFGGGKVYRGMKYASNMVWPVREPSPGRVQIPFSGQAHCFDENGDAAPCEKHPLQHGALSSGIPWPAPRFEVANGYILDRLTGLTWTRKACSDARFLTWKDAHEVIAGMNQRHAYGFSDWRVPAIRELESLADLGRHSPALPGGHPFSEVSDFYWSGTTSMYEQRYAWAFYTKDGAVGVGFKGNPEFSLWPVRGQNDQAQGNLF